MFPVIVPTVVRLEPVRQQPVYGTVFIKTTPQHCRKHVPTRETPQKALSNFSFKGAM